MQQDINSLKQDNDFLKKEIERLNAEIYTIKLNEIEKEKQFEKLKREEALLTERTKQSAITEQKLKNQIETFRDILYKLAHSINNDLHSAGHLLSARKNDPELTNAFYHIKRIDDLVNLNLWLLKKNDLQENWKQMDLGIEIENLISSTKRGIVTLRISDKHSQKLIAMQISPILVGNPTVALEREKLDIIISLIIQDLVRNTFKYSDENNPLISITLDGNSEDNVTIIFTNNKKMDEKFLRYLNVGDVEPNMSDSSKVGLRSILEWVKLLHLNIESWNTDETNECSIKITIPRSVTYENN